MKNKRGIGIVYHNVIFLVLGLVVFAGLLFFVMSKLNGAGVMEEKYAKEIALSLDAAHPGMMITLNMSDAMKLAEKNLGEKNIADMVSIKGNEVTVKLTENGKGYTYSFFNDLNMSKPKSNYYPDTGSGTWVFFVGGYND